MADIVRLVIMNRAIRFIDEYFKKHPNRSKSEYYNYLHVIKNTYIISMNNILSGKDINIIYDESGEKILSVDTRERLPKYCYQDIFRSVDFHTLTTVIMKSY